MLLHNTTIALVDDHPIVMEGLTKVLSARENLEVVGQFTRGEELLSFLKETAVNIVLLDIALPDISGIDLCKSIKTSFPHTIVVALSNHNNRNMIMEMLKNGASGYLLKNASAGELIHCIDAARGGEIVFSQDVKNIIFSPQLTHSQDLARLTNREKQVLELIALGKTTTEMAEQLYVSRFTIESHRKNLLKKFTAKNVAELIRTATQQGFL